MKSPEEKRIQAGAAENLQIKKICANETCEKS